jgi:VWFA-related protein
VILLRQPRLLCTSVVVALAFLTSSSSRPQTPGHPQSQGADTTLRVTTRLVNVNVVVTDALGNPVKDLTQDDFTPLDDGQPQKIAFFSAIDNERATSTSSLPGPDSYTNRPTDYGAPPSSTILLFDTLNSRWTSQGYGLHLIRKFLRQVEPQDHIGIYVLGDDLKVVHSFSHDASDLVEAIRRYDEEQAHSSAKSATQEESTGDPTLDRFLSGKDNRYRFELDSRIAKGPYRADKLALATQMTTASIEEIARQLSSVEGRKTLIWVTDSIGPVGIYDDNDLDEYLQRLRSDTGLKLPSIRTWENGLDVERMIRLINAAGIAVYTVDARGLETVDLGFRDRPNAVPIASPDAPVKDLTARTPEPIVALLELASRTGGRAFFNRNDLETGIRRAQDDARFTYNLAYAPGHNHWKGEWHKIQVQVNRPGLIVLARSGYFALPDPHPVPLKNRFEFFSQIAASPIESTQLALSVHIATTSSAKGPKIDAKVHLNPQSMLTEVDNGHRKGSFEVMFMQLDNKNKLLDATQKDVEADLDSQEYATITQKGWDLSAQLNSKPGATLLCVIIHDKASDAAGSIRIPLARYSPAPTVQ